MTVDKTLLALALGLALAACSAEFKVDSKPTEEANAEAIQVRCYSGGVEFFSDTVTNERRIRSHEGALEFKSSTTGRWTRVMGDCVAK